MDNLIRNGPVKMGPQGKHQLSNKIPTKSILSAKSSVVINIKNKIELIATFFYRSRFKRHLNLNFKFLSKII